MTVRSRPQILVLGTLDTKGEEFSLLRDELVTAGCDCIIVDLGIMGTPLFAADISREEVVARAGFNLEELRSGIMRGSAIDAVIRGGTQITLDLFEAGTFDGIIAMGGGSGTTIGSTIMDALPFGVPKVLVTTLSRLHPHVKGTDVVVVRTLVDLVGLNPITRVHIQQAAGAIAGMVRSSSRVGSPAKSIVITCLGVTTPCVMKLRERLLARGKNVIVLHRRTHTIPTLLQAGLVEAMVDLTPNEITEELVYPGHRTESDRLADIRDSGVPVVVSAGALDMILYFDDKGARPEGLHDRPFVIHSPHATLIRTTVAEQRHLGEELGRQLMLTRGPSIAVIPMGGFSMWDAPEREFEQREAREAFADGLESRVPSTRVLRVEANINDDEFVDAIEEQLITLLEGVEG